MKVGITTRFLNSYFSGSSPQVACALARTFQLAGHDVTLVYPPTMKVVDGKEQTSEPDWFIDVRSYASILPQRKAWIPTQTHQFDVLIEVVWSLSDDDRVKAAPNRILFVHQPPIFHDIESSVYMWNMTRRSFKNLTGIMTYDLYTAQDARYLEFLSGVQVVQVPFLWNPEALDLFCKESNLPQWKESAKRMEAMLPPDVPQATSWCARILESNFSNSSHCTIPLNIVTQIRVRGDPIRFSVHNGEQTGANTFFNTNISKNLLLPDISGCMMPRVRLPDLLQEKCFVIAHQRFRPLKTFLLDALYLGIPLLHNCQVLADMGVPYSYVLNQLQDATKAWVTLKNDYTTSSGFFNPGFFADLKQRLINRFSPQANIQTYSNLLSNLPTPKLAVRRVVAPLTGTKQLRIHFCELWSEFVPKYNFFMYLFSWIGSQNNVSVVLDSVNPNLVVYGPLSKGQEKAYPGVNKLFFTGENTPIPNDPDIVFSLGFQYNTSSSYMRLPLWMLEINWFNANPDKIVNPRPVSLSSATRVDPAILDKKTKFCAFVATNPGNANRNATFNILNGWRHVDSAGRLFCNRPEGPLPAGLGGGGGELIKVDYYKDYKFVIAYENSAGHGYTTEKILHAKVAGAVPIYWGDPFVDRDFTSGGFINANQFTKPEDLIEAVKKVADDPVAWRKMAETPALTDERRKACEQTMEHFGKRLFKLIVDVDVSVSSWDSAHSFGPLYEAQDQAPVGNVAQAQTQVPVGDQTQAQPKAEPKNPRVFVTAATEAYVPHAVELIRSMASVDSSCPSIVYLWSNVSETSRQNLRAAGATEIRIFPDEFSPPTWQSTQDFWQPQHFAWKLWLHADMNNRTPANTSVLYLDSGIIIVSPLTQVWLAIEADDIFILDDEEQTNERWCHPTFCETLKITPEELAAHQIWAGCVGFKAKGKYIESVHRLAIGIAEAERKVIVGEKWTPYSQTCLGHRHDQSILSLLTQRASAPRHPLKDFYCDQAYRTAQQWGTPFYVHRGHFKLIAPLTDGIDEAYVINLERRSDRLELFKKTHKAFKNRVYVWRATDGRTLQLNSQMVHCFRNNDFKWKKSVMGCALSHLGVWEKLANDPIAKTYLIMEDDVVLDSRWLLRWMTASKSIPADADVIYLGGILPPNKANFSQVVEKVNEYFGKVAKNTLFGGTSRRYFHFCNYAYVLTQQGARKLVNMVKDKGIFTSGDHMIVNHGDQLLNIYFTIPLLATCFQENDPVYQTSEFNNFNRVDTFDSDLWNNTECFTEDEVFQVLKTKLQSEKYDVLNLSTDPVEQFASIWNTLLECTIDAEFEKNLKFFFYLWTKFTPEQFTQTLSYIQMLEQAILNHTLMFMKYKDTLYKNITTMFPPSKHWTRILDILTSTKASAPLMQTMIFHLKMIDPTFLEAEWLSAMCPHPIVWKPLESLEDLFTTPNPILLYQAIPGDQQMGGLYRMFVQEMAQRNKTMTILHLSDEASADPIDFYNSTAVRQVIRNYPRPALPMSKTLVIPLGYANGRAGTNATTPAFKDRPYLWSFAGSMDRQDRSKAIITLQKTGNCILFAKPSWSDPPKLDSDGYIKLLRDSKFIPCFAGFRDLESYRLYEALEHGAIPFYVPESPKGPRDTYADVLGQHPILSFPSWEKAAELLPLFADKSDQMDQHRAQLQSWWSAKKAEIKQQIQRALPPTN